MSCVFTHNGLLNVMRFHKLDDLTHMLVTDNGNANFDVVLLRWSLVNNFKISRFQKLQKDIVYGVL